MLSLISKALSNKAPLPGPGQSSSETHGARLRLDFEVPTADSTQPAEISFDLASKDLFQDDEGLVDRNSSDAALLSRLEAELHKLSVDQRQEEHRIRKQQQQKESVEASFSSQQMQLPAASQEVGAQHENHIKRTKEGENLFRKIREKALAAEKALGHHSYAIAADPAAALRHQTLQTQEPFDSGNSSTAADNSNVSDSTTFHESNHDNSSNVDNALPQHAHLKGQRASSQELQRLVREMEITRQDDESDWFVLCDTTNTDFASPLPQTFHVTFQESESTKAQLAGHTCEAKLGGRRRKTTRRTRKRRKWRGNYGVRCIS